MYDVTYEEILERMLARVSDKFDKEIALYFKTELRLTIKGNWQIFPSYVRGVDFVGYRTFFELHPSSQEQLQELQGENG